VSGRGAPPEPRRRVLSRQARAAAVPLTARPRAISSTGAPHGARPHRSSPGSPAAAPHPAACPVSTAINSWDNLRLSYTEPAGLTPLREAVASLLYGREVAAEQMVVCAPEEGVYLTMKALLRPGDRVVRGRGTEGAGGASAQAASAQAPSAQAASAPLGGAVLVSQKRMSCFD
jgi:hypothetical protein